VERIVTGRKQEEIDMKERTMNDEGETESRIAGVLGGENRYHQNTRIADIWTRLGLCTNLSRSTREVEWRKFLSEFADPAECKETSGQRATGRGSRASRTGGTNVVR